MPRVVGGEDQAGGMLPSPGVRCKPGRSEVITIGFGTVTNWQIRRRSDELIGVS